MTDLRSDLICEKVRSVSDIRKYLAMKIKNYRNNPNTLISPILSGEISALRWVLRQNMTPQEYFKETYQREYPK